MASFTGVGDNVTLSLANKGEKASVAISGTYAMQIDLQREVGSKGSGSYETLKSWSTANATVAYNHYAEKDNEQLRLIVIVDTSGTATATLTDTGDQVLHEIKDPQGNVLMRFTQEGIEYSGALRRIDQPGAGGGPTYLITASLSITREDHAGKCGLFNVAGGATATLPAATGSGDEYEFFVLTTLTSPGIVAALGTDIIQGGVAVSTDAGGVAILAIPTADYITMNGSTTGGLKGSNFKLKDVSAGVWSCNGFMVSSGAEATPFAAT